MTQVADASTLDSQVTDGANHGNEVVLQPLQWSNLRHIDDVRPIDATDAVCLDEIRGVLERHGYLDRFGVALLHSHFQLADDEILLETTDVKSREHWVRPVSRSSLSNAGIEAQTTVVCFDEKGYSQRCACARDKDGHCGHIG